MRRGFERKVADISVMKFLSRDFKSHCKDDSRDEA
jgi:hypothetical protein